MLGSSRTGPDTCYDVQQYVVAILDIMGQTEALRVVGNPLDDGCDVSGIPERWRRAAAPVFQLQKHFRNALLNISRDGRFIGLDSRLVWQAFGDSVVVGVPFPSNPSRFSDTYGLVLSCAAALLGGLIAKVPLQCSVELGLATTDLFPHGQVYGPALEEVHTLLVEKAEFPRVIVGPRLRRVLGDAASRRIGEADDMAEGWAKHASGCLAVLSDADELCYVDYLGRGYAVAVGGLEHMLTDIIDARLWIEQEERHFREAGRCDRAAKYARLREYFESRVRTGGPI